eukprot:Gb_34962 [translate_table: standard]
MEVIRGDVYNDREKEVKQRTEKKSRCEDWMSMGVDLLPGLPHEIALDCLGRLPIHLLSNLITVCKAWHSLFSSITFYSNPSQGLPNNWIYAHLDIAPIGSRFYVWNLHNRICLPLAPFPSKIRPSEFTVAAGKLFSIGGSVCSDDGSVSNNRELSAEVWAYDPCTNTWGSIPPMKFPRSEPAVGTIGGKIYVVGGCRADSSDWAEVYDPLLGIWSSLSLNSKIPEPRWSEYALWNRKLFLLNYPHGIVFDPTLPPLITVQDYHDKPSDDISLLFSTWGILKKGRAVVKDIFFAYFAGRIRGYDSENKDWLMLQGIGRRFQKGLHKTRFVNVGDKLCVLRLNEQEIACVCFDIHKYPGRLRCNVLWHHSVSFPAKRWGIRKLVSIGQSDC